MKKIISVLLIAALALSFAACGAKKPADVTTDTQTVTEPETTTDPAVTEPEVGRIGEKGTFYVYIPEHWCKMEYVSDDTRLRVFDTPSAPKIKDGETPEVEIKVSSVPGKQADVDAAVKELLKNEGAKKGKDVQIDGTAFTVVTYTDANEKRTHTVYTGLGGGGLASIEFKGVDPTEGEGEKILNSLSFKSLRLRDEWSSKKEAQQSEAASKAAAEKKTTEAAKKDATTKEASKKITVATTKSSNSESKKLSEEERYNKLTNSEKKAIGDYIQSRYDYYDKIEGKYSGDKHSDSIMQEAAKKYDLSVEHIKIIWMKYYEY